MVTFLLMLDVEVGWKTSSWFKVRRFLSTSTFVYSVQRKSHTEGTILGYDQILKTEGQWVER